MTKKKWYQGSKTFPEIYSPFPLTFLWLELCHTAMLSYKRDWEIEFCLGCFLLLDIASYNQTKVFLLEREKGG